MRETFAAVFLIAALASSVGLWGVWRHQSEDIHEALERLPGQGPEEPEGLRSQVLEALFGGTRGALAPESPRSSAPTLSAAERLERIGELSGRYHQFRDSHFSEEVQPVVRGICADREPVWNPHVCIAQTRAALLELRSERQRAAGVFELVLGWSRVLWAVAFLIAAWLVYQGYNELRVEARRRSRPIVTDRSP